MEIRLKIDDALYYRYKDLAEKNAFAVTRLNQILFEQVLRQWIFETEKREMLVCSNCGKELDYDSDDNEKFLLQCGIKQYFYCETCFKMINCKMK